MSVIAIVGASPERYLPDLEKFHNEITMWIGADRGALSLINQGIHPDLAIGDFDSINTEELDVIETYSKKVELYSSEKDETDLELAINKAVSNEPESIYLFGVTGGRIDHELANLQLLYLLKQKGIEGTIIDGHNKVRMVFPGNHSLKKNDYYSYVSFLPFSPEVTGITLTDFRYPLENASLTWGSTLCISNEIPGDMGFLTFKEGILYIVQSRDTTI